MISWLKKSCLCVLFLCLFLLLECFLFLGVFSENTTDCIDRIRKNTCANKCHNDHINLFRWCDWHNVSIANGNHRNTRPINRIKKLDFPIFIENIRFIKPSVSSRFRLYESNIMKSAPSKMSQQKDYQQQWS